MLRDRAETPSRCGKDLLEWLRDDDKSIELLGSQCVDYGERLGAVFSARGAVSAMSCSRFFAAKRRTCVSRSNGHRVSAKMVSQHERRRAIQAPPHDALVGNSRKGLRFPDFFPRRRPLARPCEDLPLFAKIEATMTLRFRKGEGVGKQVRLACFFQIGLV